MSKKFLKALTLVILPMLGNFIHSECVMAMSDDEDRNNRLPKSPLSVSLSSSLREEKVLPEEVWIDGRTVNIKGTFSNAGHISERSPCTDHKTWTPLHFNKFEGSEALIDISRPGTIVLLVPPQDFCEITIPEDGVYLFIINYCWSSCPNTRYTGIAINGIYDIFAEHVPGPLIKKKTCFPGGYDDLGFRSHVSPLKRGDIVNIGLKGNINAEIFLDHFTFQLEWVSQTL